MNTEMYKLIKYKYHDFLRVATIVRQGYTCTSRIYSHCQILLVFQWNSNM